MKPSKRRQFIIPILAVVLTSIMPAALAQVPESLMLRVLSLKSITDMDANHPARTPSFTLVGEAPNQHLMLWWHIEDVQSPFNRIILIDNATWNGTEFTHPGSVTQKVGGLDVVSQLAFNTGGPSERANLHFAGIPHKLAVASCVIVSNEVRQGMDATISLIAGKLTPTRQLQFEPAPTIYSNLPSAMEGSDKWPLAAPDIGRNPGYYRPSLLIPKVEPQWFMVGTDNSTFWLTHSLDQGKTWKPRQTLKLNGENPNLVMRAPQQLCLFYIDAPDADAQWPDDVDVRELATHTWPRTGRLMECRSRDDGVTWSEPQVVVNDELAIQSCACVDAAGRLWLIYVQSDLAKVTQGRASLWLTSSGDGGQTWLPPARLTEGRYLDREPDIIAYDGKLLVAFTRGYQAVRTNIWVAEVDPKAVLAGQLVGMPLP